MTIQAVERPDTIEYASSFSGYVSLVPETEILKVLHEQLGEVRQLVGGLSAEQAGFRYAPDKWTIREVIGHITDAERVFSFRALTFARGDSAALPGFDENEYVREANFDQSQLSDVIAEFEALRKSNLIMLGRLGKEAWTRSGIANGRSITVRALAYIMAGHVRHHMKVLRERYLQTH